MLAHDNPFRVSRVLRERYRMDEAGWLALVGRLERNGWRGAIVGPHGTGKTTLLEDLGARLERAGWRVHLVRLSEDARSLPPAPAWTRRDFVLVDGAEQLTTVDAARLRWRARGAGGFVVTAHDDSRWRPVVHRCVTSAALLRDLTTSLGEPIGARESAALYERHRGNLRDALRELYDRAALAAQSSSGFARTAVP